MALIFCSCSKRYSNSGYFFDEWYEDQLSLDSVYSAYYRNDFNKSLKALSKLGSYPSNFHLLKSELYLHIKQPKRSLNELISYLEIGGDPNIIDTTFYKNYLNNTKIKKLILRNNSQNKYYSDTLPCILLNMAFNDQVVRNSNYRINQRIVEMFKNCQINNYLDPNSNSNKFDFREEIDELNFRILDSLYTTNKYPFNFFINNDYILDIPKTIIIHQNAVRNDVFIKRYASDVLQKKIHYHQYFSIIGNRIKRFSDSEGCTVLDLNQYTNKKNEQINLLKSIIYSGYLIVSNNPYNLTISINKELLSQINKNFTKSISSNIKIVCINNESSNYKIKVCFNKNSL